MANKLLSLLSSQDRALLAPSLESVPLVLGADVEQPDRDITHVYFLDSGLLTVVASLEDDRQIEIAMIGSEGMTGVSVLLENHRTPYTVHAHLEGEARRIAASDLRAAMTASATLRSILLRYAHCFLIQIAQTALANGTDKLEQRAARWLLMVDDRVENHELLLTHEFVARALSVRRPGVTDALHLLEGKKLIRSSRGSIKIVDRRGLETVAGTTYGPAETEYRRLMEASARPQFA
jgi:CRP-like cAMP-binding protein